MTVKNALIKSACCSMEYIPYSNLFICHNKVSLPGAVLRKLILLKPVEKLLVHRVGFVVFNVEP